MAASRAGAVAHEFLNEGRGLVTGRLGGHDQLGHVVAHSIGNHHFAGEACVTFAKARASIDEKTLFELGAQVATAFEAMVSSRPATLMRRAERVAHVARAS